MAKVIPQKKTAKPVASVGKKAAALKSTTKPTAAAATAAKPSKTLLPPKAPAPKSAGAKLKISDAPVAAVKVKQSAVKIAASPESKQVETTKIVVTKTSAAPAVAKADSKKKSAAVAAVVSKPPVAAADAKPEKSGITLPPGFRPSDKEEYMGPEHAEYFRQKLLRWRDDLIEESKQTIDNLREEVRDVGDEAERATRETENSLELRTRDRYRKLLSKINKALLRIEDGSYGFCEETGEPIGVARLEARPIATMSLDAQERWEHRQKQMGD